MNLEEMDVFKLGHALTLRIYGLTGCFPDSERFGLISQLRRGSVSICSNLMEGYYRTGINEFKHFISIARGSCGEVRYQILLSKDLGYLDNKDANELDETCDRLSRMLRKLCTSLTQHAER
jgi:four helix bundle protein